MIEIAGYVEKGTSLSAGLDLFAAEEGTLHPQEFGLIDVGITWKASPGFVGIIKDRSSLACKGLRVGAGVIDADYEGPIKVLMHNCSFLPWRWEAGDKIAQMLIFRHFDLDDVVTFRDKRGEGGFGSTDR